MVGNIVTSTDGCERRAAIYDERNIKMNDAIYVVDPTSKETLKVESTTFSALKLKERQDLQEWIIKKPEVIGEPLLLITSEFDRFHHSDKRLDLLLLDKLGRLVIAELKLDASGTLAEQQVIRYAAFCSTMSMEDVVANHSNPKGLPEEEIRQEMCEFLGVNDLPELTGEPRIILVAGSMENQELTATVLWLRKFGVDHVQLFGSGQPTTSNE